MSVTAPAILNRETHVIEKTLAEYFFFLPHPVMS
jgi:hypothetical protein